VTARGLAAAYPEGIFKVKLHAIRRLVVVLSRISSKLWSCSHKVVARSPLLRQCQSCVLVCW